MPDVCKEGLVDPAVGDVCIYPVCGWRLTPGDACKGVVKLVCNMVRKWCATAMPSCP